MVMGICFFSFSGFCDEFRFDPPENFTLSSEYIALHHPVKTTQPNAQLYFDQGLTFLYAFNHEAAYWSFLKASEIDRNMAMAYWGQALVLGPNINIESTPKREKMAFELVQKAEGLAENGPENEKAYIAALKERYSNDAKANKKQLSERYSEAMKKLTLQLPDDLDATVLFAESLVDINPWDQWGHDGKPKKGTKEAIDALESVLIRSPMHLGANHYYIHIIEASPFPYHALMSAERLKTLLPSSGHILHMPSHIFILVGDYEQAVLSNQEAIAADWHYIEQYGISGIYPIHYLSHNYHFLSQAYSFQGNYQGAQQAAKELLDLYLPYFTLMPELEEYASTLMFVYLRFHQWQELLNLPQVSDDLHITKAMRHFGRGVAFAKLGNVQQALEEQKLFLAKSKFPPSAKYGHNDASQIFKLAQYYLKATIASVENQTENAIENLQKAIEMKDNLRYDEPPSWLFSIRTQLGAILLKKGRFADAEEVFREDLKQHPRNGRALFGLKMSLEGQGKCPDYWVDQAFQQAWRFSDIELSVDNL